MCLLVQPSLLTVITVVGEHSINIQHPSARHGGGHREQEGNGAATLRFYTFLYINEIQNLVRHHCSPCSALFTLHCIWGSSMARRNQIAVEIGLIILLFSFFFFVK